MQFLPDHFVSWALDLTCLIPRSPIFRGWGKTGTGTTKNFIPKSFLKIFIFSGTKIPVTGLGHKSPRHGDSL